MENNQMQYEVNTSFFKGIGYALGDIFGLGRKNKELAKQEQRLNEELELVKKEEEKLGATKRIDKLASDLQNHELESNKINITKSSTKLKTPKKAVQDKTKSIEDDFDITR